ncbi:SulP family inorganic anion transporter [Nitrincola schmidtii]|uniref:SulP family inorganic anion transporter n=1 Tax=Nitrincola schmidtii TaxID=1730894 RepID=UPI00124C048F|nr:sulfate permease [Nitrincola schmidtii]
MDFKRFFPIFQWLPLYGRETLISDLLAAVIVTIMLIPQSLAYAMLAGLPPEVGLYASIAPLFLYAIFGTSRTLAVGPVAVIALMTAAAAGNLAIQGSPEYVTLVIVLTFMSGIMLTIMGLVKLGFLANFLSHPVISGFITASGLIIAASQARHLLGLDAEGVNFISVMYGLIGRLNETHLITLAIGLGTLAFLYANRFWGRHLLTWIGFNPHTADMLSKAAPVLAVALTTFVTWFWQLDQQGVKVVGEIPTGLPPLSLPPLIPQLWSDLFLAAVLISIVGFVESVSVGQTLAAKRRQRIDPNQELIGLGAANLGSAFSSGMPVSGGFSRSIVNFDAGAATPAAGAYSAVGILVATLFLTPLIAYLPVATLAATIIVAVLSLIDLKAVHETFVYSKSDFAAMLATILITLTQGVELGIMVGVGLSLLLYLYRTSRPHYAVIGRLPNTEHFRNIERYDVEVDDRIALLRIDESLYFANSRYLEDVVMDIVINQPKLNHLVLTCQAVNLIDSSALDSLRTINRRLKDSGVQMHLAEVKGPVMDRLKKTDFLDEMSGVVYMSTYDAWKVLHERAEENESEKSTGTNSV